MKPVNWDTQLGLASPLEYAASQSGKIKSPSNKDARLDASHTLCVSREGREENFFLDILFNRMSVMGMYRQPTWHRSEIYTPVTTRISGSEYTVPVFARHPG